MRTLRTGSLLPAFQTHGTTESRCDDGRRTRHDDRGGARSQSFRETIFGRSPSYLVAFQPMFLGRRTSRSIILVRRTMVASAEWTTSGRMCQEEQPQLSVGTAALQSHRKQE